MNIKHICYLPVMALLLAACSSDLSTEQSPSIIIPDGDDDLVPVTFTVGEKADFTRAATNIVTFNNNEEIKVFVKPAGGSYTGYTYTTALTEPDVPQQTNVSLTAPATPPYFPAGAGSTVEAYAYYPASAVSGTTFSVQDNQISDANYKLSDLMFAENRTITKGSADGTNLAMAHLMAQLHLNITGTGLTVSSVKVYAKRSVTFSVSAAGVPSTTLTGDASDIVAATAAGDAYVCIPVQPINTVQVKVVASGDGDEASRTATFTFTSTSNFEAGKSYPINLTVSAAQLGATTAIADWNGQQSVTYAPTGDMTIDPIAAKTYKGSEYTASDLSGQIVVKKNGSTVSSSDYDVQLLNNTNAGTAVVVAIGKNTHAGSVAVGTFTINPKTLTDAMVGDISAQTYTRSQITPTVTVTDGSALTLNTHYTVSYGENINVASGGSVTVTGTGNYTGSVVKDFTISPKDISSMTLTLSQTGTTYTGSAITASVSSLTDGGYTLASGTDYDIKAGSTTSATNAAASAGAAVTQNTITVTGKGNYTGEKSNTWSIARATPTLTISSYTPNPMNLTSSSATGTISVSRSGDGEVTATSSATGVATTSVSGTTVTVTAVADGSATITIKMNQSQNYSAYTASDKTVSVLASGFDPGIAFDNVNSSHKGYYIARNGKAYSTMALANQFSSAVGYICYAGSVDKYFTKFIAIALTDAHTSYTTWSDALSKVNTYASSNSITVGSTTYNTNAAGTSAAYDAVASNTSTSSKTRSGSVVKGWRLPSVTDWRYIFQGLGNGTPSATSPAGVSDGGSYGTGSTLRSAINTACGNTALQSDVYWSSSEGSSNTNLAWYYGFNYSNFFSVSKTGSYYVRAVFAY